MIKTISVRGLCVTDKVTSGFVKICVMTECKF